MRLWDSQTGRSIGQPIKAQIEPLQHVAFSRDGRRIVSAGDNGVLRQWNAASGEPIAEFKAHVGPVLSAGYSADGLRIVSSGEDGTLRQWQAPQAWPALVCAKLDRNFSRREWQRHIGPSADYQKQCPELPVPADADF